MLRLQCLCLWLLAQLYVLPIVIAQQDGYFSKNQYSTPTNYDDFHNSNNNNNYNINLNNIQQNDRDRNRYRNDNDNYDNNDSHSSRAKSTYNLRNAFLETFNAKEPTYFIVASRMVRPRLIYQVAVNVLQAQYVMTVHASISCDGVQISDDVKDVKEGVPETLLMRIPPTSVAGKYKLRVEGYYKHVYGGSAFLNETDLQFSQRSMTIFIQTDKPLYMQGEIVRFRTIPITTELKGFDNAIDVYMLDPSGHIVRRWLSR